MQQPRWPTKKVTQRHRQKKIDTKTKETKKNNISYSPTTIISTNNPATQITYKKTLQKDTDRHTDTNKDTDTDTDTDKTQRQREKKTQTKTSWTRAIDELTKL